MSNRNISFSGEVIISKSNSNRSLYKHQREAIKALKSIDSFEKYKGMLVIPTGGGKTFTSVYWVMNQMINKNVKVLWLAHRHELLNQTIDTVINKASFKNIIPDKKSFTYRIISGLNDHDRPVNISPKDDFIIASKDSLIRGKDYLEKWIKANKNNICIIVDEAHHAVARTYREIIDLTEKYSDNWIRILGLTATPTRTSENEKGLLKKIFPNDICYSVDLKTLIAEGILAKPILVERKTNEGIRKELTAKELGYIRRTGILPENIAKDIILNKERNNFIVKEYIKNKDIYGKTLVFAINIEHAITLNALFREKGIKSDFIVSSLKDSYTGASISVEENNFKIKNFKEGKLEVLVNVNILTEGTDIPSIHTIFLTRPTTSSILLNQMIGRGLRGIKAGGTEEAYLVSFIDEWRYKINWVSPKNLEIGKCIYENSANSNSYEQNLINIKFIEDFSIYMDKKVSGNIKELECKEYRVIGAYLFTNIYDIKEIEEEIDYRILVFKHLKNAFEEFIDELNYIHLDNGKLVKDIWEIIDELMPEVRNKYFEGYDLSIGYKDEDVKNILYYYINTNIKPKFTKIDCEENKKLEFLAEAPRVIQPSIDYSKLSMSQIRSINPVYWRKLRNEVFEKYMDDTGVYVSATGIYKSKSRRYFEIDHKVAISKGGATTLDNLQLLARWENKIKGVKTQEEFIEELSKYDYKYDVMDIDSLEEILKYSYENGYSLENTKNLAKEIIRKDENSIVALNLLGKVALAEKKYRLALIYSNKVLKEDTMNEIAMYTKASTYLNKQNYKEAIKQFEIAIKLAPSFEGYVHLGDCYVELKKKEVALNYYCKAIEYKETAHGDIEMMTEVYYNMGRIYFSKRKYEDSLKYYNTVIKLDANHDYAINNAGVCLERMGKLKEALKYYKEAHKLNSKDGFYRRNINQIKEKIDSKSYSGRYEDKK